MNNVLQCPRCEVRFPSPSELNDHLASDHPDFRSTAATVEDDLLSACHCHHHGATSKAHSVRKSVA